MNNLLDLVAVLSILFALFILRALHRQHFRVEYSVSWLGAAVSLFALSRAPGLLHWLTAELGLPNAPISLILLILIVLMIVFYRFSAVLSQLKDSNIALAQRVAILEFELNRRHEETRAAVAR
jgi:hypothetical protein